MMLKNPPEHPDTMREAFCSSCEHSNTSDSHDQTSYYTQLQSSYFVQLNLPLRRSRLTR